MGLIDKLKMAATPTVVENLLAEGSKFKVASQKIQRRWKYVAVRRLKEIQAGSETKAVAAHKAEKPPKTRT